MLCDILLGKNDEVFASLAKIIRELTARKTAMARPAMSKSSSPIGMDEAIEFLADPASEKTCHQLVCLSVFAYAIAMSEIELLALQLGHQRLMMHDGTCLLRDIVEDPDIVIAREPMHLDATVGHLAYLAKETGEATRHDMLVFEPIVDDIAKQIELVAIVDDAVEKTHNTPLVVKRLVHRSCTEMQVAYEIDFSHREVVTGIPIQVLPLLSSYPDSIQARTQDRPHTTTPRAGLRPSCGGLPSGSRPRDTKER